MQTEILNPLAMMLLRDQIRDGEVVRVRFDPPNNRLWIKPNHKGVKEEVYEEDGMDLDDEDALQIEEIN